MSAKDLLLNEKQKKRKNSFCFLSLTFVLYKIEYDPPFFVVINQKLWINNKQELVWNHPF